MHWVNSTVMANTTAISKTTMSMNITATATASITHGLNSTVIRPSNTTNAITATSSTIPSKTQNPVSAHNFTSVVQAVASSLTSCYHLPQASDGLNHGVMLHNSELRNQNISIPTPYIEAFYVDVDGIRPLLMAVQSGNSSRFFIDISKSDQVSVVDPLGNSLLLDSAGIHFATNQCQYALSLLVDNLYRQLAAHAGMACAARDFQLRDTAYQHVTHIMYIKDQCGSPVSRSIRQYPELAVAGVPCNVMTVDDGAGKWTFDCLFSNTTSVIAQCEQSVASEMDRLFSDPFNNACPDLADVVTTLSHYGQDILGTEIMVHALQGLTENGQERLQIRQTIGYYQLLWVALQAMFSKDSSAEQSSLEEHYDTYNDHRDFSSDVCHDLHPSEDTSFNVSFRAGATYNPALLMLSEIPVSPAPMNVTIQNPAKIACCNKGFTPGLSNSTNTCSYPEDAFLENNGCVCGMTASSHFLAFKYKACHQYETSCDTDNDCKSKKNDDKVCLIGSCCGHGICIDPFECSQDSS